ncbi:MAG: hypothetical protein AAGK23_08805, partial [Pseudomonadota bacterium]
MTKAPPFIRKFANHLALSLLHAAGEDQREWALAMAAEIDAIGSDWHALGFAFGCWQIIWRIDGRPARWARFGLATLICGWAGAKAYLVWITVPMAGPSTNTDLPNWIPLWAGVAGVSYVLTGLCLLRRRFSGVATGLCFALMLNAVAYLCILRDTAIASPWLLALIGEDYVIWTMI